MIWLSSKLIWPDFVIVSQKSQISIPGIYERQLTITREPGPSCQPRAGHLDSVIYSIGYGRVLQSDGPPPDGLCQYTRNNSEWTWQRWPLSLIHGNHKSRPDEPNCDFYWMLFYCYNDVALLCELHCALVFGIYSSDLLPLDKAGGHKKKTFYLFYYNPNEENRAAKLHNLGHICLLFEKHIKPLYWAVIACRHSYMFFSTQP